MGKLPTNMIIFPFSVLNFFHTDVWKKCITVWVNYVQYIYGKITIKISYSVYIETFPIENVQVMLIKNF